MRLLIYISLLLSFSFSAFSQKLLPINNHSFEYDLTDWDTGVWGENKNKPTAYFDILDKGQDGNKSLKITIRKNSKNKNGDQIFLKRNGFKLKKGKEYKITFWVKSKAYKDQIMFRVYSGKDTGSNKPWCAVFDKVFEFNGNGNWQKLTHTFTAKPFYENQDVDYKNLAILFGFDKRMGTYLIDNIKLERL